MKKSSLRAQKAKRTFWSGGLVPYRQFCHLRVFWGGGKKERGSKIGKKRREEGGIKGKHTLFV